MTDRSVNGPASSSRTGRRAATCLNPLHTTYISDRLITPPPGTKQLLEDVAQPSEDQRGPREHRREDRRQEAVDQKEDEARQHRTQEPAVGEARGCGPQPISLHPDPRVPPPARLASSPPCGYMNSVLRPLGAQPRLLTLTSSPNLVITSATRRLLPVCKVAVGPCKE